MRLPEAALVFGDAGVSAGTVAHWVGALLLLLTLLLFRSRWAMLAAAALLTAELFLASLYLPYNDLAPPEVYLDQRFTISQLLAYQAEETVPGRALSISQRYFDPGDVADLRARYDRLGLDAAARFHALDAVKRGEMLSPNLSLTWGIPTLDGYGGGITPTRRYALYSSLLLPARAELAVDGRVGERLALPSCRGACIPDLQSLRATDTRYLITDKVYDIWHEGIAYDTALARFWTADANLELPDAFADQARILRRQPAEDSDIALPSGHWLTIGDFADQDDLQGLMRDAENILALTLVNSRHPQIFYQLQPPPFERALSSSIKVYRLPLGERAFLAGAAQVVAADEAGDAEALRLLRAGESLLLHGAANAPAPAYKSGGNIEFVDYDETVISLRVDAPEAATLVIKDAYYPGWEALVNDAPTPIYRANLLFRAIPLPAGESVVVLRFEPTLWRAALYIGVALWIIAIVTLLWLRPKETSP